MMNFIEGANLEYILLTHGHFDHIGGVKAVKAKTGAKVVISKEDEPMLTSSKLSLAAFCGGVQNNTEADILILTATLSLWVKVKSRLLQLRGIPKAVLLCVRRQNIYRRYYVLLLMRQN